MTLTGTRTEPMRLLRICGWAIRMQDEKGADVQVLVSDEALQDIASPPSCDIARLNECRSKIEAIASAKHTAGATEADGGVRITSRDIH